MFELLDFFTGGVVVTLFWFAVQYWKSKPAVNNLRQTPELLPSPSPVSGPGTDKVYVRFNYLDSRVEVKKFKAVDLDLKIIWKGRIFEAGEWTPDGHIYNEVSWPTA